MPLADTTKKSTHENTDHGESLRAKTKSRRSKPKKNRAHVAGSPPSQDFIEQSKQQQRDFISEPKLDTSSSDEEESDSEDALQLSSITVPEKAEGIEPESDLTDAELKDKKETKFALYQETLKRQGFLSNKESINAQLSTFVTNVLFPHLKFITSKEELNNTDPETSLMSWVTHHSRMNIHLDNRVKWWTQHKRQVNISFNKRRNNCTKEVKTIFLSEYCTVLLPVYNISNIVR